MADVPYESVNLDKAFRWCGYAAFALAVAGFAIFQPLAKADPPNSAAYGCYIAANAPSILLDASGMSIRQRGFPGVSFHLERHKTAITLTADAPIQADIAAGRYSYSMYHPGVGKFLDFQRVEAGRRYGQFDEERLTMFSMVANDGNEIIYERVSLAQC